MSAQSPARRRTRFDHPLSHYAARFEKSERTLKNYIATGHDAEPPDLPPFDEPEKMESWWMKHMRNRVPDVFRRFAAEDRVRRALPPEVADEEGKVSTGEVDEKAAGVAPVKKFSGDPSVAGEEGKSGGLGFVAALQRLRTTEEQLSVLQVRLLESATLSNDEEATCRFTAQARTVSADLEKLRPELRKYEADAPKILAAAGRTWVADDVVAAWELVHSVIAPGVRGLWRRNRAKLRACATPEEEDAHWQEECDRLFLGLTDHQFTRVPELDGPGDS